MRLHQLPSDGWVVLGPGEPAELVYDGDVDPCSACESLEFEPSRWQHALVADLNRGVWSGGGPRIDWERPTCRAFVSVLLGEEAFEKLAGRTRSAWTKIEVRGYRGGGSRLGYLLTAPAEALETVPIGRPFGGWRCDDCGNYVVSHVDIDAGTVTNYVRDSDLPRERAPFVMGTPKNYRSLVCPHESVAQHADLFARADDFSELVPLREDEIGSIENLQLIEL